MKNIIFKYPKFIFAIVLVYTMYSLSNMSEVEIGVTEILLGFIFPILPVWASSHFFYKLSNDLKGSFLNILVYSSQLFIFMASIYIVLSYSAINNEPIGLLMAFAFASFSFFVLFCIILMLSVFAKGKSKEIED